MLSSIYAPPALYRPGEITITPWSYQSLGASLANTGLAPASQNFVTANLAVFIPFGVPGPMVCTKMFWGNGAAVAGNLDAGIYDMAGVCLVSTGSTAQVTTAVHQIVDITDIVLARGLYYLALASDTSGATQKVVATLPPIGVPQSLGLLQQAAAFPLATNANPATYAIYASAYIPVVGLQGYRTIGP